MKAKSKGKLAIFDTFKTKDNDLTGEAKRQRAIITILGSGDFGRALALRMVQSGYTVCIGSRNPERNRYVNK